MQYRKKKAKEINMVSIAESPDNIEVEGSQEETLGTLEYIIKDEKLYEGDIQSFIEVQESEINKIIEGMCHMFVAKYFFILEK